MGQYENGIATRQSILAVCRKLFLEKGFHETSSSDICREANVTRNTIYYYFKNLENIRYEVLWEMLSKNRLTAYANNVDGSYITLIGICMSWCQAQNNPQIHKFYCDYCRDYPFYSGNSNFSVYHNLVWKEINNELLRVPMIDSIQRSSLYGYIIGFFMAAAEEGAAQTGIELSILCVKSVLTIWGIERERIDEITLGLRWNMKKIPEELLRA